MTPFPINRRALTERIFTGTLRAALLLCVVVLLFLLGAIIYQGAQALSLEFLLSPARDFGKSGGILYQIIGSLLLVITAAALSLPLAIGTAVFRHSYARRPIIKETLDTIIYALNTVPSVTYGIFGLIFFINILGTGLSWFVGSIILAIMMLPTVTLASVQAMDALPKAYRENALALGMEQGETIRRVILPQSTHGIITGQLMALARAIGETAPIMFIATAFSGITLPRSAFEPVVTLPTHILALAQQSTDPQALRNAWGASLTLIILVTLFSLLAFFARTKFNRLNQR